MVCLGNICRSPIAEGILRRKIEKNKLSHTVESAGTGAWHVGEKPDIRAIRTAKKFGVDISKIKARKFLAKYLSEFDKIYVMDHENYENVISLARPKDDQSKVQLILNADQPGSDRIVPDPYYDDDGFENVFKMIDKACDAIIKELINEKKI